MQAWLGSRLLIVIAALVIAIRSGSDLLSLANHWDAELYGLVAQQGYLPEPNLMAFFPGLPLIMAGGLVLGIPTTITGIVVSVVGSALAAAALVRLARPGHRSGDRRTGPQVLTPVLWLFAPTAVFTLVPYTESMFCAAAFWAWERARARDWRSAAILAAVAASFRVSGVFLIAALGVLALTQVIARGRRVDWAGLARRVGWLLLPVGVVLAYLGYLYAVTGNPFAWYQAQQDGWMREFTWPWQSALNTWDVVRPGAYPDHPWWPPVFRMEVVSMVLGLVTTGWCLGRRRWAEAVWVGVQVLAFSTSYWFYSVNRATLLWFPLWIMLAELASVRPERPALRVVHRVGVGLAGAGMLAAMLWWCWLFFTGHWAS